MDAKLLITNLFAASSLAVTGVSNLTTPVTPADVIKGTINSTVLITTFGDESAKGSGWFVDNKGDIATAAHVIKGSNKIFVTLNDGRALPATLVGVDTKADVAVLHVNAGSQTPAALPFRKRDDLEVGQKIIEIGNPQGFSFTATSGQVTALGRQTDSPLSKFIQEDAPTGPGNSGGPLINMKGEVVGMVTEMYSGGMFTTPAAGLVFALPSSVVAKDVNDILKYGKTAPGETDFKVTDALKPDPTYPVDQAGQGVRVTSVTNRTKSDDLKPGDVITAFDNKKVEDSIDFNMAVHQTHPGERHYVFFNRGDKRKLTEITMGGTYPSRPSQRLAALAPAP